MGYLIGSNPGATVANLTDGKAFGLGDRLDSHNGNTYVYVQANGAIVAYDAVGIDENFQAAKLTKTMTDAGWKIGVAQVGFADDEYGWVAVRGSSSLKVKVLGACAADASLYTSGTAGSLDDASTSQTRIDGIVILTAAATAATAASCLIAVEPSVEAI